MKIVGYNSDTERVVIFLFVSKYTILYIRKIGLTE